LLQHIHEKMNETFSKKCIYTLYLVTICSIGVEFIGNLFFIVEDNLLYLKKSQLFIEDKEKGYTLKPNFQINGANNKLYPGISLLVGSHGLRMPEFDDRPKIVVVGDSVAFGFGLNYEDTISSKLEKMLGSKYQVVNAGVPGYNLTQWQSMGTKLASILRPEIVVALVNANDFQTMYYPIQGGAEVTRTRSYPWEVGALEESNIPREKKYQFIIVGAINKIKAILSRSNGVLANPEALNVNYESLSESELKMIKFYNSGDSQVIEKLRSASESMNEFSGHLKVEGVGVIFAFLPFRVSAVKPDIGEDKRFNNLADNVKTDAKIKIIKLQNLLYDHKFFLPNDSHTNKLGNDIIANALAEKITVLLSESP